MGSYDTVKMKLHCPYCGRRLPYDDQQTKDLGLGFVVYSVVQALVQNARMGGGFLRLYFSCKACNKQGHVDISDYDYKLEKEIAQILKEEKEKLEILENQYVRDAKNTVEGCGQ